MREASAAPVSRLRQWRTSKGFTLGEVAGLCGLRPDYLSRIERGERELGPGEKVEMARRLSVKVDDLFEVEPLVGRAAS